MHVLSGNGVFIERFLILMPRSKIEMILAQGYPCSEEGVRLMGGFTQRHFGASPSSIMLKGVSCVSREFGPHDSGQDDRGHIATDDVALADLLKRGSVS